MSIEQTLQNIADALLKVAESNHAIAAASMKTEESYRASIAAYAASIAAYAAATAAGQPLTTIEADVTKVETDAKAEQKRVMEQVAADRKPSTAKEAVADALAKAKAEKETAAKKESETATQNAQLQGGGQGSEDDDPLGGAPELDWDKDVRPALLAVGKDRDALVKLMAKYDVPKGGKAPTEKWADLLAEANKIVAARG